LRLFRRGRREEEIVYEDLRAIGCAVTDTQARVDFGSGVSGSIDGIVTGVPFAEKTRHVLEIKTHSRKSFEKLDNEGVQRSKPLHYAQMQLYMLGLGLDRALYYAVCKDDDSIYTERVKLDRSFAESIRDRAIRIALSDDPPMRLTEDPNFWICKMCDQREACHAVANQVNCRTCAHSTHREDDSWHCARWLTEIPSFEAQLAGCPDHVMHPGCAPSWTLLEGTGDYSAVYRLPGEREVINGEGGLLTSELV
jgi:CRISPR/Cas system-associated exonuclease Cas4 (RecB family)